MLRAHLSTCAFPHFFTNQPAPSPIFPCPQFQNRTTLPPLNTPAQTLLPAIPLIYSPLPQGDSRGRFDLVLLGALPIRSRCRCSASSESGTLSETLFPAAPGAGGTLPQRLAAWRAVALCRPVATWHAVAQWHGAQRRGTQWRCGANQRRDALVPRAQRRGWKCLLLEQGMADTSSQTMYLWFL